MSTFESPCVTGLLLSTTWVRRRLFEELTQCPQVSSHIMKDTRLSTQTHLQFLKLSSLRTIETLPIVSFLETLLLLFSCLWFYVVRKNKSETSFRCKKQWQKTFGLRKVANMFQSFFSNFPIWYFFHYPHPLLFKYILLLLTPSNSFVPHPSLLSKSQLSAHAHCSLTESRISTTIANCIEAVGNVQVESSHQISQHFLPFSTDFQIIMLMLRLEVGEGER